MIRKEKVERARVPRLEGREWKDDSLAKKGKRCGKGLDPRDVVVTERRSVTYEDLKEDSMPQVLPIYSRLDATQKGKKCGRGYIPRARKCFKQMVNSSTSGSVGPGKKDLGVLARAAMPLAAGVVAGGAAIGAIALYREYGQMAIGRIQAGDKWTQKNPPGEPWVNKRGVVEFPEIKGFSSFKNIARRETGDKTVYPFASGIMGLVFKSKKDDSFVLKVPKDFLGRSFSVKQARREWKNLVVAEKTGLTPKPLRFYRGSNSIKMENLMDTKRPGGIPAMLDKSYGKTDPDSIVTGFTRLHSTGVSHGDASASNLMVQKNGQLLFVDLGNKEVGDRKGTMNDLHRVKEHLRKVKEMSGREASRSPHLKAMDTYLESDGSRAAYERYRRTIRGLHSDIH